EHEVVGEGGMCECVGGEVEERREWGAGVVVDDDVGLRTGCEQRLLPFRCADVGRDRDHLCGGRLPDVGCGRLGCLATAAVDYDIAPRPRKTPRAGTAQPLTRGADDGPAAGNAEIHGVLPTMRGNAPTSCRSLPWRCGTAMSISHPKPRESQRVLALRRPVLRPTVRHGQFPRFVAAAAYGGRRG